MNATEAAAVLGRIGGKSTSSAKQAASRANGRLGGRPRKNTSPTAENEQSASPRLLLIPRKDSQC